MIEEAYAFENVMKRKQDIFLKSETSAETALKKSLELNCRLIQDLKKLKEENTRLKEMLKGGDKTE